MAARVTTADVLAIRPSSMDMTPFIAAAHLLVDQYMLQAGLGEDILFEMERWWSAHLAESADPGTSKKDLGTTALTFRSGKLGVGLEGTMFGQQVLIMDVTGTLAVQADTKQAVIDVF